MNREIPQSKNNLELFHKEAYVCGMEDVSLEKMTFHFSQDSHCMSEKDGEFLEIECLSDQGIDGNNGFYMVLKTEQWAIDSIDDLKGLIERIQRVLHTKGNEK